MSFFHHTRDRALVLAALAEGPAFGLEVVDRVKRDTGGRIDLGQGVYPVLRELDVRGDDVEATAQSERREDGVRPDKHGTNHAYPVDALTTVNKR